MTEFILGVFGFAALVFAWLLHGSTRSRLHDAEKEADEIYRAMRKNAEADNSGPGSELDERVRRKYSDR